MLKTIVSACAVAVLASTVSISAQLHEPVDRRTFFTFSQPVTLPGVTLPAGRYIFRLVDDSTSRRVIQVLNGEGTRSYALLVTIPSEAKFEAVDDPEVGFMETAENMPHAIRAWWYPGQRVGYEFVYPREQALRLARATNTSVLTVASADTDTASGVRAGALARVSPSGKVEPVTVRAHAGH